MPTTAPPPTKKRPTLNDVPLAAGVDLAQVKGPNDKEILVELRPVAGLTEPDAKKLAEAIQARTLNAFRGHVAPADRGHAFKDVVASWVGAAIIDGTAYVRGVIHDAEVQRWVNSGRLDLDAVVESSAGYYALDFMSLDRGSHAGSIIQPGSPISEPGKPADTTMTGDNTNGDSAGEMRRPMGTYAGAEIPALPKRTRSYADSARQTAEHGAGTTTQQAPAATVGLKAKRVTI
jgi:hypothetical protein